MKSTLLIPLLLVTLYCKGQTFTIKSNELGGQATNKQALNSFGCNGENISPQLIWANAPKSTKSFALTMYDENAPTGSGWWHWVMFDIPLAYLELPSDAGNPKKSLAPKGSIQSKTDFGTPGYGGPCPMPNSGFHKYTITVYALDTEKLGPDANASPALVGFYLSQHTLAKASIVFYDKK